jgi:hypothetical protein
MTAGASPGTDTESVQGLLADLGYRGDNLTEESLGRVPRPQIMRGQALTLVHKLLVGFIVEHLPPSRPASDEASELTDIDSSTRSCVERLIKLIFCSDEYVSRCQETQAGIDKQIELWNFLSRNASRRPFDRALVTIISGHVNSGFLSQLRTKHLPQKENHVRFACK